MIFLNVGYVKQEKLPFQTMDRIKYFFGMVTSSEFEQGYVFCVPVFEKEKKMEKVVQNLLKQIQKAKVDTIVFSNDLINSSFYSQIEKELKQKEYQILNGRRLMNYMNYDIFGYILNLQKTDIKKEELFFLINKDDSLDLQFLSKFVENCKMVNIVTNDLERFKKIQENLYEKENILISVSNNRSKSLKRAKYIFNVNMDQKDIEKYKINRNAMIVNFRENLRYNSNIFDGICVNYFQINLPDEYIEQFDKNIEIEEFDRTRLYESILMKKIEIEKKKAVMLSKSELKKRKNIVMDMIYQDEIKVVGLIGNNGKIDEKEIIRNYQQIV